MKIVLSPRRNAMKRLKGRDQIFPNAMWVFPRFAAIALSGCSLAFFCFLLIAWAVGAPEAPTLNEGVPYDVVLSAALRTTFLATVFGVISFSACWLCSFTQSDDEIIHTQRRYY